MGKEVSSYAQSPACAPASRSNSRFYLSGKAAAWPAPHVGSVLSAHLVWGCGGAIGWAIGSPFRRAAPLLCV